jgi:hypothetical protein
MAQAPNATARSSLDGAASLTRDDGVQVAGSGSGAASAGQASASASANGRASAGTRKTRQTNGDDRETGRRDSAHR